MNLKRVATLLLITGVVLTSLSVGLLVRNVVPSFSNATKAQSYQTPVSVTLPLEQGDHVLWVADEGSSTAAVFGNDFTITDDSGQALPFRAITRNEVLSRSDGQFIGEISFTVPSAGNYAVAVRSDVSTRVVISEDFFSHIIANAWWVGGAGIGLIMFLVGVVLIIVATRRNRRAREQAAFVAMYGFPPGYGPPPMAAYGPSAYGPPPAYPSAPQYPGSYRPPPGPPVDPTLPPGQPGGPISTALPYPGWYPDPEDRTRYRWWSGTSWEASYADEKDFS